MKVLGYLVHGLLGQVEPGFFRENQAELRSTNYRLLKKAYLFATGMCAFIFLLTLINPLIEELRWFYLFFTLLFAALTAVVLTVVNRKRTLVCGFYVIFAIAIFVLVINVGTCLTPHLPAVTFHVFLLIIPILYVTRPAYAVLHSVVATLVFCLVTAQVKGAGSYLGQTDILNAICCCMVGIGFDVTIINQQLETIRGRSHFRRQSATDELTGLPNRRRYDAAIESRFLQCRQAGWDLFVMMMDIDDFKLYNDTYGHLQGDECLRRVGRALERTAQIHGAFVARYGGEEFVCICDRHSQAEVDKLALRFVECIEALKIPHSKTVWERITISVGYAILSDSGENGGYRKLLQCADAALYTAKSKGKNCAVRWKAPPL